jgi:hypothetical protein
VTVLALSGWLAGLEGLPRSILVFTGCVNLLYGSFSLSLALRPRRPLGLIRVLAVANVAWLPVCLGLLAAHAGSATPFAVAHLGGEGLYVAGLGILEWRNRHRLAGTAPRSSA